MLILLALIPAMAAPDTPSNDAPRLGLGATAGVWAAESAAPQLGGHLAVHASRRLDLQLFAEHAGRADGSLVQLDHVIGFHTIVPVARWEDGFVAPTLGACTDFRTWRRRQSLGLQATDVLFGPRLGVHVQHAVDERWTVQATATGIVYIGNTEGTYSWGVESRGLTASPVVQGQVGLTRWFGG